MFVIPNFACEEKNLLSFHKLKVIASWYINFFKEAHSIAYFLYFLRSMFCVILVIFLSYILVHPGTPSLQHPMASASSGQHSAPSTPQSQTPNLHPAPSPVHQPPPSGTHGQPPTPTGHPSNAPTPQPMMYAHGHMTTQHPLHANHSSSNQGHPFAASYAGTPQPIVILPQQPHAPHPATFAAAASSLPNHHLHGQTPGSHVGTPTHVLPHAPMAMIPTSAAMVHNPTAAISTGHYVPHSQGK